MPKRLHSFLLAEKMIPRVSDLVGIFRKIAPFQHAEDWDNVGLQVGNAAAQVSGIMVALDGGQEALAAAVAARCQLLLTHHPFLFRPLKRIDLAEPNGRLVEFAIKNDLAVVSLHTNYDIAEGGVSDQLAERLGVGSCAPLRITGREELVKLSVFVPRGHEENVLAALFRFSGFIGNYSDCSFQTGGTGTFRPLDGARPFLGQVGKREYAEETRIEVLLRKEEIAPALNALIKAHPYEEPAFDLYPLLNDGKARGLGRIGELEQPLSLDAFAATVKERLGLGGLRIVGDGGRRVARVALCGGSGASLMREAARKGADLLVTGDVGYHDARDAQMLGLALMDIGHFASEALMTRGLAERLRTELGARGFEAEIEICGEERDPFVFI